MFGCGIGHASQMNYLQAIQVRFANEGTVSVVFA